MNGKTIFGLVIGYIVLNLILFIVFINRILPLAIIHIIIIIVLLILALVNYFKNMKKTIDEKAEKINDLAARKGFLFATFTQNSGHLFLCYIGFFYMFCTLYIFYLIYKREIVPPTRKYIIVITIIGLILAIKETILQFSQCFNSANSSNFTMPECDKHYYRYWNCLQNKSFVINGEEEEEEYYE